MSYQAPIKLRASQRRELRLPPGSVYLGSDDTGHYVVLEGFFDDIGNMFKRMVKFTPKSFRPAEIFKAATHTTATIVTAGAYQLLPSKLRTQVANIGKIALPVVGGAALAVVAAPAVMSLLGPKLATVGTILGKNPNLIGGALSAIMGGMSPPAQAMIAEQVTPQQIAQYEQTGQIPPDLQALLDRAAMQSYPTQQAPMMLPGPAQPYQEPVQAGMFGGGSDAMILFLGVGMIVALVAGRR